MVTPRLIAFGLVTGLALTGGAALLLRRTTVGWNSSQTRFTMPNQWRVTPVGTSVDLPGDMPGAIVFVSADRALINTSGYHDHSLNLVDTHAGKVLSSVPFKQAYVGLGWDGTTAYLSGGGSEGNEAKPDIRRFTLQGDQLVEGKPLQLPELGKRERFVSALLPSQHGLLALNVQSDEVFRFGVDDQVVARQKLGYRPYAMALSPDGKSLAVSEWGNESVALLDSESLQIQRRIKTRQHPTAVAWHPDGRLFITESASNTVAVVKADDLSRVTVSVDKAHAVGPTPLALSFSPDGRTLYAALAGDNAVAVVDVTRPSLRVKGYIPTERYPSAVSVSPDGKTVAVATAKGFYGPNAGSKVKLEGAQVRGDEGIKFKYILQQLAGRVALVPTPGPKTLASYTQKAIDNLPLGDRATGLSPAANKRALAVLKNIKHVVYVIKENRTYDQVFGDIERGNGDPSLVLFGKNVTPNQHLLTDKFVLMDNLYTDGECSQVGHQWTNAAYANDYEEKQTMLGYSGRQQVESDTRLIVSPDYIWNATRRAGLKARVYGEYVDVQEDHNSLNDPEKKADPEKYGYSAAWEKIFAKGGRDTEKIQVFIDELKEWEKTGDMPSLSVMALPDDHTHGMSPGAHSPRAMVACNDQAVGMLIEALSHSKFWKSTAVFVIQDDAQAGPDHVDSHRTIGQFISPYTRTGKVDSTHYSTTSMLRTMELILGLKPMTSFDAHATPMLACLTDDPDFTPYVCLPPQVNMDEKNPARTALGRRSDKLDWSDIDRADFAELNKILWEAYKPGVPYPG